MPRTPPNIPLMTAGVITMLLGLGLAYWMTRDITWETMQIGFAVLSGMMLSGGWYAVVCGRFPIRR